MVLCGDPKQLESLDSEAAIKLLAVSDNEGKTAVDLGKESVEENCEAILELLTEVRGPFFSLAFGEDRRVVGRCRGPGQGEDAILELPTGVREFLARRLELFWRPYGESSHS
jgi:hypothetical protein